MSCANKDIQPNLLHLKGKKEVVNIHENVIRMYVNQSQDYFSFRPKEITDAPLFLLATKVLSKPH